MQPHRVKGPWRAAVPCHAMPEVHDAALGAYSFVQGAAFELSVLAITENAQGGSQ